VCRALGASAAYVPYVEQVVHATWPLLTAGTDDQRDRYLSRLLDGTLLGTAALSELVGGRVDLATASPSVTATWTGSRYRLDGVKACVPGGLRAGLVLVPATVVEDGAAAGTAVFLLELPDPAVHVERQDGASRPEALLTLGGVEVGPDQRLGGDDADADSLLRALVERATVALCCVAAGACVASVQLAASYTKTREQFGKPIASFQAVAQRVADAYVDSAAISLTSQQAAWRLSAGLPASKAVATAKFWASEGGDRVVHAAVHVHGGVGVDRSYPLHRSFLLIRQLALTLGGPTDSLRHLGALIAAGA
jgi:alkylation response protein AidB-like acyl-CoA dehydrogenase